MVYVLREGKHRRRTLPVHGKDLIQGILNAVFTITFDLKKKMERKETFALRFDMRCDLYHMVIGSNRRMLTNVLTSWLYITHSCYFSTIIG